MKGITLNFLALVLVFEAAKLSSSAKVFQNDIIESEVPQSFPDQSSLLSVQTNRFKRQRNTTTTTTTTPKPRKHRPSNIFSLISVLLSETRNDTNRAFNEIGTLFNSQFANGTTKKPPITTTTTTTPSLSSTSDNDEDNEVTTTTEMFRITRDEFLGILRSNVRGIVNLFGKEFRVAIKDSNQNVREFGRDLGNALAPYFNN